MALPSESVLHLPTNHAAQRLDPIIKGALRHAQQSVMPLVFPNASNFAQKVMDDCGVSLPLQQGLANVAATDLSDKTFSELRSYWTDQALAAGAVTDEATRTGDRLARRSQLVRAFHDPEAVEGWAVGKVREIVRDFPKTASHIEVGRNPGDVVDPYILAATQSLLHDGNAQAAVGSLVAHKAMMILEGLMGHLHEEVLGRMRGNMRAPEPRGENQEMFDALLNPFPGCDIVQPPAHSGQPIRFHQVKAKTGTLNSSGGARLAAQMRDLRMRYAGSEVYSHSLVGNTLRGHRSMGGMLRSEPALIIMVGEPSFRLLTGTDTGAELLLRFYQDAFAAAATQEGYEIDAVALGIANEFRTKAEAAGEGYLEAMLHEVTRGPPGAQDSRTYERRARSRRD
jgi:hypothetical protein